MIGRKKSASDDREYDDGAIDAHVWSFIPTWVEAARRGQTNEMLTATQDAATQLSLRQQNLLGLYLFHLLDRRLVVLHEGPPTEEQLHKLAVGLNARYARLVMRPTGHLENVLRHVRGFHSQLPDEVVTPAIAVALGILLTNVNVQLHDMKPDLATWLKSQAAVIERLLD